MEVLYISGSGRSGSTLLERILHSSSETSSLGEFHCLWRMAADDITCSCGSAMPDDPFWKDCIIASGLASQDIQELKQLEAKVCRTGYLIQQRFSLDAMAADTDVRRFLDLQFRLFSGVSKISGSALIVDSSKAGPRAWLLASDPRVRILHLYRDPADVIVSWRSAKFDPGLGGAMKRPPISAAALDWWKVEQLMTMLGRKRKVCRINYHTFCLNPRKTLELALTELGVQASAAPAWISDSAVTPGGQYHSLNGNPDRFDTGTIEVRERKADWNQVPPRDRLAIKLVASALRMAYPY